MKKVFFTTLISIIILFLVGCDSEELEAPTNLHLTDYTVEWNPVEDAIRYEMQISTDIIDVYGTSYTFDSETYGEFIISVRTVYEDAYSVFCSPLTIEFFKELQVPENLTQTGTLVTWDSVNDATGYVVKYNNSEFFTTLTHYNIVSLIPVEVQVMALGSEVDYISNSDYSEAIIFSVNLSAPENLHYANDIITWDSVDHADGYLLVIEDLEPIDLAVTQYILNYSYVGLTDISVTAYSNIDGYNDSLASSIIANCVVLNLATPDNIEVNDGILTFTEVAYAEAYEIYVNGTLYATISETTYNIPASVQEIIDSYIQVKAISSLHNNSELSTSIYVNTNVITTLQELANMSEYGSYVLGNDIYITDEWIPIAFSGVLDGNGFAISGLSITETYEFIGLFSTLENAIVKNLTISGSIIISTDILRTNIGGLAGSVYESQILNVIVEVDITAVSTNGIGNLGGVFGRIESVSTNGVSYDGIINATNFATGGFAGRANNSDNESELVYSNVSASITVSGGEQAYAGGFIGILVNNNMMIDYALVDVTLVGPVYVGGFIGYLGSGHIANAFVIGSAEASSELLVHLGGFSGRVEGYNVTITNGVSAMVLSPDTIAENIYVGGFSGSTPGGSYGSIYTNCMYDITLANILPVGNDGVATGITGVASESIPDTNQFTQ